MPNLEAAFLLRDDLENCDQVAVAAKPEYLSRSPSRHLQWLWLGFRGERIGQPAHCLVLVPVKCAVSHSCSRTVGIDLNRNYIR
jgi:hypothetical protein